VSVHTWHRLASLPPSALRMRLSDPYAMAMESPKNRTFTSPS
jgi:hypothetical protein